MQLAIREVEEDKIKFVYGLKKLNYAVDSFARERERERAIEKEGMNDYKM